MKRFKEQFPSLAKYIFTDWDWTTLIKISLVKKHCLDKQKVKETFNKINQDIQRMIAHPDSSSIINKIFIKYLEELGIES